MTETLTRWPDAEAPLDIWLRPLSALCDSPRSHAYAATEFEGRDKAPVERRLAADKHNAKKAKGSKPQPNDGRRRVGWAIKHERRERLARMVEQGMTVNEMAEAEGTKPKNIRDTLQRMGLKAAPGYRSEPGANIDRDELVRMWEAGATYRDMAARFNTNPGTLSRKLGRMGLRRR